ncbi:MAG: LysR family transcriptional regulator [Deltaproteobacteria bacterium]|nr:LysR family transcriptional regulator [Deltaproteobacteria bacterium]
MKFIVFLDSIKYFCHMDLHRLTLHQLRVFRTVARHCSYTRAARELLLTQSAVSAQVRALTALLGVPLLEQHGKAIHLTAAGRSLVEQAGRVEAIVREIGEAFTGYRDGETGTVRVGASTSIGTYFFPAVIAAFAARHPRIEVLLEIENTAHIEERLLRDDFDIGYLGAPVVSPRLAAEPFLEDEIVFACGPGHPLATRPNPAFPELLPHRLIVREPGSATRRTLETYVQGRGFAFPDPVQLGSVEAIKQAVMAGLGYSYFSGLTIRHELETGRLVGLSIDGIAVTRTFVEVRHRDKTAPPAFRIFREFAREQAKSGQTVRGTGGSR